MIDVSQWIEYDPEILGGQVVFIGTRITVTTLFDNLMDDVPLSEILDAFPSLPKDAALAALKTSMEEIVRVSWQRYQESAGSQPPGKA